MIVFGGKDDNSNKLNDVWEFNLETNRWSFVKAEDPPLPRSGHSASLYNDTMVVFGGMHEVTKELNDVLVFNIKNKKWVTFFEEMGSPVRDRSLMGNFRDNTSFDK